MEWRTERKAFVFPHQMKQVLVFGGEFVMFGTCCLQSFLLCSSLSCWWICGTKTCLCNVNISSLPHGKSKDLSDVPIFFENNKVGVGGKAVQAESIVQLLWPVAVGLLIRAGLCIFI